MGDVRVADNRTSRSLARCMPDLAHNRYWEMGLIRVVLSSPLMHAISVLQEALPGWELHREINRMQFNSILRRAP
jgi:hypothetical protein